MLMKCVDNNYEREVRKELTENISVII